MCHQKIWTRVFHNQQKLLMIIFEIKSAPALEKGPARIVQIKNDRTNFNKFHRRVEAQEEE